MKEKFLLLLTLILIYSCNNEHNTYQENCELHYKLTLRDNNDYTKYLLEAIEKNISNDSIAVTYHKTNSEYIKYLDSIINMVNKNSWELFFDGENYSQTGKDFISLTNNYEKKLMSLTPDQNIKKRIHYLLNTNDIQQSQTTGEVGSNNENNIKDLNTVYFRHLDYYFMGVENIYIETFISNRKRNLLELENEFLLSVNKKAL